MANTFKLPNLCKLTLSYIERCFTMVSETRMFLELNFSFIKKILASSELHIDSELEVLKALEMWIDFNGHGRKQFAKDLLLKVRLNLLSDRALKFISQETSLFKGNNGCVALVNKALENKKSQNNSSRSMNNRYCSQDSFDITFSGYSCNRSYRSTTEFIRSVKVDARNMKGCKKLPSFEGALIDRLLGSVYCKGEIFVLANYIRKRDNAIALKKYSLSSRRWKNVAYLKNRLDFCVCTFIDKVYILGGFDAQLTGLLNTCTYFDTKDFLYREKEIASLKESRCCAASTVFKGKIILTGGFGEHWDQLNTVAAYDHVADEWSKMPNMVNAHSYHDVVTIKNKMYVISRKNVKVFDGQKFVLLKPPSDYFVNLEAFSTGNKIHVVNFDNGKILKYDTVEDEWSEEPIKFAGNKRYEHFVKIPKM